LPLNETAIRTAFRGIYLPAVSVLLPQPVWQFENVTFDPGAYKLWAKETLLPTVTVPVAWRYVLYAGIMQLDIFAAIGIGTDKQDEAIANLRNVFKPGQSFVAGSGRVQIDRSEPKTRSASAVWYTRSVDITFRFYEVQGS